MLPSRTRLPIEMMAQPDETTCGPTCLEAIYRYWGLNEDLGTVITRTQKLDQGGTLAVFLAVDALKRGFTATIYTYNLMVFDPTWFPHAGLHLARHKRAHTVDIAERLQAQRAQKADRRLKLATEGYLEFLQLGGKLMLADLTRGLIRGLLNRRLPILTGLSSTFLYRTAREFGPEDLADDIRGQPAGHFVVIAGYNRKDKSLLIADPYGPHPFGKRREYWISIDRVIGAVLLGIVTHDANLLILEPGPDARPRRHR